MRKKILLYAPPYMDLYKDIIQELTHMGYDVDYLEEMKDSEDPYNLRSGIYKQQDKAKSVEIFNSKLKGKWIDLLNNKYKLNYDYFLVLDGQAIHSCVFDILRKRNSNLRCVNYLFDTSKVVYEFYHKFKYFDDVFSFDPNECREYDLKYLPIYWVKGDNSKNNFTLFGFGAYIDTRFKLFRKLKEVADKYHFKSFLKLYQYTSVKLNLIFYIKYYIRKILGKNSQFSFSPSFLRSSMGTTLSFAPQKFREYIYSSDIIIDTCAEGQVGMTARFMWALGAGKRIITNNTSVKKCDFYTSDQIFIINDISKFSVSDDLIRFITKGYKMPLALRNKVDEYRIDNWLQILLNNKKL